MFKTPIFKKGEIPKHDVYVNGPNSYNFLNPNSSKLPNWLPVLTIKKPRKIVGGESTHILVWYGNNQLELHHSTLGIKKYELENEQIKDIITGAELYLILTKSGRVYSLTDKYTYHENPLSHPEQSTFQKPRLCDLLTDLNLFVESIAMSYCSNFYLCKGGLLYGSGFASSGRLGVDKQTNQHKPLLVAKNVTKVFSGAHGLGLFYITNDNKLFTSGRNDDGKLGLDTQGKHIKTPVQVKKLPCDVSDIKIIQTGQHHSILLTKQGKVYASGTSNVVATSDKKSEFNLISALKDKIIVKLAMGEYHQLLISNENELYGWGFRNAPSNEYDSWKIPRKIKFPNLTSTALNTVDMFCGSRITVIYSNLNNNLSQDFKKFFENRKFTDCVLGNGIKCNKSILQFRTNNTKIETIQEIMKEKTKEEINSFLKWIYYDEIVDLELLENILKSLQLSIDLEENSLNKDLLKLYNDQDSTDFNILVKDDDDDEEEEEETYEEIPVHKIILCVRSGLFREMFENLNENQTTNSVKDYSGKSIESLEILIKYFYTDKIELTADNDPILVIEELEDSIEYYQLNADSNLKHQLNKLKIQYKLN
ncbi:regulator of chromosome condensation [Anaeramoeba flamelloides]|uniref:Regulator of chromosome condensation n=1 Tax=Anaeramoeba flamelloides TaxID=1746091 RepID=A0AAV7YDR1_9EUKA|nr:regulator of chromosome condensation [Anaeramoeba flamelloides]